MSHSKNEIRNISIWHPAKLLGTWFWSGLFPVAPGTIGSIAAMPFAWIIVHNWYIEGLLIATALCFVVGWVVCDIYYQKTQKHDPKEIVIDEVAGMWLCISLLYIFAFDNLILSQYLPTFTSETGYQDISAKNILLLSAVAFIAFRLFDIWKPWPVNWADSTVGGGLGIMLDDIIAACYAAFVVIAITIGVFYF